ncbi:MAG: hypothetical protein K9L62_02945 [Vallitaleaceae bacterium]|nr:hypothetical protein [Vallitaleaceae bacterium]
MGRDVEKRKKLEQERQKLHLLIANRGSKEAIQKQSEVVDKHIFEFYLEEKGA